MPQEGLMASATQMLAGGVVLLLVSTIRGETWPQTISLKSWGALLFLVVLGSLVAYSAYQYLLKTVRPLVASSNTFVNPVVAFIVELMALGVILVGVFLVLSATNNSATDN
jgi:drug/metabolite transporter (DMT)-like permease